MQKDETVQLHIFLFQLRTLLENMLENNSSQAFLSYDKLDITPHQIHKSIKEHNLAIFELSIGIANLLEENDYSISKQIHDILERMCNLFRK